jgi:hypothetical protein
MRTASASSSSTIRRVASWPHLTSPLRREYRRRHSTPALCNICPAPAAPPAISVRSRTVR